MAPRVVAGRLPVFPPRQSAFSMAILNVGAPAAGMNAAVRSAVRVASALGHKVYAVSNGFEGLAKDMVSSAHRPARFKWDGAAFVRPRSAS